MKIGLISDTHGYLDPTVFTHFKEVDEVWHAGDIGTSDVANALEAFKPLRAVFGNIDSDVQLRRFREDYRTKIEGKSILMTHIAGSPPRYNSRIKKLFKQDKPNILICGHSHILRVINDKENNVLYINPGAAGHHGFHIMRTIIRFELTDLTIKNLEVIELGRRGRILSESVT